MRKSLVIICVAVVVAIAASIAILGATPGNPQNGVGVTADVNPMGCTDCHVKTGDEDSSLKATMKKYFPKHSSVKEDINNCYLCHGKRGDLGKFMHRGHLAEGNDFVKTYGGSCTHCHKVDAKTGEVGLKGRK